MFPGQVENCSDETAETLLPNSKKSHRKTEKNLGLRTFPSKKNFLKLLLWTRGKIF